METTRRRFFSFLAAAAMSPKLIESMPVEAGNTIEVYDSRYTIPLLYGWEVRMEESLGPYMRGIVWHPRYPGVEGGVWVSERTSYEYGDSTYEVFRRDAERMARNLAALIHEEPRRAVELAHFNRHLPVLYPPIRYSAGIPQGGDMFWWHPMIFRNGENAERRDALHGPRAREKTQ